MCALRWGLTEQQGRYADRLRGDKVDAVGALEASLRGVVDCEPWCIHFASPRYGWDQGTSPKDVDPEGGKDYEWVKQDHALYDPKYKYPWLAKGCQSPGMSVTYCELVQAWLSEPSKPVHALVTQSCPVYCNQIASLRCTYAQTISCLMCRPATCPCFYLMLQVTISSTNFVWRGLNKCAFLSLLVLPN